MARITIYDKNGNPKLNSHGDQIYGKMKYVGQTMSISYLEFNIASPFPIAWNVGDYVDYGAGVIGASNTRFMLFSIPQPRKDAEGGLYGGGFVYSGVQFHDYGQMLSRAPFTDMQVTNDNLVHFSNREGLTTFENVEGIAARIEACLSSYVSQLPLTDPLYGLGVSVIVNTNPSQDGNEGVDAYLELIGEAREFSLGGSVLDALNNISDVWPAIGWGYEISGMSIRVEIGTVNFVNDAGYTPAFSRHNGVVSLRKYVTNQNDFLTRLVPYGSDRNLISRYYNKQDVYAGDGVLNGQSVDLPCLMLPIRLWGTTTGKWDWGGSETARPLPDPRKAYLESQGVVAEHGVIEKIVRFNNDKEGDIYPSLSGVTINDLWDSMSSADDYYPDVTIWNGAERIDEIGSVDAIGDNGVFADDGSDFSYKIRATLTTGSTGTTIPVAGTRTVSFSFASIGTSKFKADILSVLSDGFYISWPQIASLVATDIRIIATGVDSGNTRIWTSEYPVLNRIEAYMDTNRNMFERVLVSNVSFVGLLNYLSELTEVNLYFSVTLKNTGTSQTSVTVGFGGSDITLVNSSTLNASTHVHLRQIGFDIKERLSVNNGYGTLNMKTGLCAGREFSILGTQYDEDNDTWDVEIERVADGSTGMVYPNDVYPIAAGDQFVLTDIQMPELYVSNAEVRLYNAALKYYDQHSKLKYLYDLEIDSKWIHGQTGVYLRPGMYMQIVDSDLIGANPEYVLIDTVTITENESNIPTFKVTLREKLYLPE